MVRLIGADNDGPSPRDPENILSLTCGTFWRDFNEIVIRMPKRMTFSLLGIKHIRETCQSRSFITLALRYIAVDIRIVHVHEKSRWTPIRTIFRSNYVSKGSLLTLPTNVSILSPRDVVSIVEECIDGDSEGIDSSKLKPHEYLPPAMGWRNSSQHY